MRVFFIFLLALMVVGCTQNNNEIETTEEPNINEKVIIDELPYDQANLDKEGWKNLYSQLYQEFETLDIDMGSDYLNEWAIREFVMAKLSGKTLSVKEIKQKATQSLEYHEAWLEVAQEKYQINPTEEELDQWISENIDTIEPPNNKVALAETLGITLTELDHEIYRDLNRRLMVWTELRPLLEEKYGAKSNELHSFFNNEINELKGVETP